MRISTEEQMRVVHETRLQIAGRPAEYRLCETGTTPPRYRVEVAFDGTRQDVDAGGSLAGAADLYERLWRGSVTPCTLCDVVEDLRGAGEFPGA